MKLHMEVLDKNNPHLIEEFEKALYEAFHHYSNPGVRALWIWDDEGRRLKTRIPYECQEIFFIRDEQGRMSTASSFSMDRAHFQSGAFGFQKPALDHTWCETLTIFCDGGTMKKLYFMELGKQWLKQNGIDFTYATSNEANVRLHKRAGAEVLEKSETEGQVRYFIRYDFKQTFARA